MDRIKGLSTGSKIVLACGSLLFFSLFATWQHVLVVYGGSWTAVISQDGWDLWGLLIALVLAFALTIVVVVHATDVQVSDDVPWEQVVLGLALLLCGLTLLKNVTDAGSTWVSYLALVLTAGLAGGAYLDWSREREWERQVSRLSRSTRSSPGPS